MKNNYLYASISKRRVIDDEYITNVLINSEIYLNGIYSNGVEYYVDGSGNITTDITDYRLGVGNPDGSINLTMEDLREPFVATMITTSSYEEVILPLVSGYDYDFTIDWGDGSPLQNVTSWDSPNRSHNYTTGPQLYTVTIRGSMPTWRYGFSWNPNGTPIHLQEIVSIGDVGFGENISQFDFMFSGCVNLTSIPLIDTSSGQNFSNMFAYCLNLTSIPELNTSSGQDFSGMFQGCSSLTTILELDTSSGQNFGGMFYGCINLTSIPELNTSSGQDFSNMFYDCINLTSIPQLDTSSGLNFRYMFYNCSSLEIASLNGTRYGIDYYFCPISDLKERNNIYTYLADLNSLGLPSATITMPTSIGEDDSIATLKGWSVYRAP